MRIVVCVKHVPDTDVPLRLNAAATGVEKADLVWIPNPPDLSAVEWAVQMAKETGAEVVAVSLGPPEAAGTLRRALAIGASRTILVSDPALAGMDAYATAACLAPVVRSLDPGLVLCGVRSLDGSTGLVGPALAEILGLDQIGRVAEGSVVDPGHLIVLRKLDRGARERIRCRLPVLLTVETDIARPHDASLPALLESIAAPIDVLELSSLGISDSRAGTRMSLTKVIHLDVPRPRPRHVKGPPGDLGSRERILAILAGGWAARRGSLHHGAAADLAQRAIEAMAVQGFLEGSRSSARGAKVED